MMQRASSSSASSYRLFRNLEGGGANRPEHSFRQGVRAVRVQVKEIAAGTNKRTDKRPDKQRHRDTETQRLCQRQEHQSVCVCPRGMKKKEKEEGIERAGEGNARVNEGPQQRHAHVPVALRQLQLVARHVLLERSQREALDSPPAELRRALRVDLIRPCRNVSLFQLFPTFVPSPSWQTFVLSVLLKRRKREDDVISPHRRCD